MMRTEVVAFGDHPRRRGVRGNTCVAARCAGGVAWRRRRLGPPQPPAADSKFKRSRATKGRPLAAATTATPAAAAMRGGPLARGCVERVRPRAHVRTSGAADSSNSGGSSVQPCCAPRRAPPVRTTKHPEIDRQVCNVAQGWQPANRQRARALASGSKPHEDDHASTKRAQLRRFWAVLPYFDVTIKITRCVNSPMLPTARSRVRRSTQSKSWALYPGLSPDQGHGVISTSNPTGPLQSTHDHDGHTWSRLLSAAVARRLDADHYRRRDQAKRFGWTRRPLRSLLHDGYWSPSSVAATHDIVASLSVSTIVA